MEVLEAALFTLAVALVGTFTVLVEKIRRDLLDNTALTEEAKNAANGTLRAVMDQLNACREHVQALQATLKERDDCLDYLISHIPEASYLMSAYTNRRNHQESNEGRTA